jgi:hypothetical protein
MIISDRIYGDFEITAPVILDLLSSPSMQRLKGISQLGLPQELHHEFTFSRWGHCIGVILVLRKLGASEEEQIAGLLHDVSHTAFSHVVDWVFGDRSNEDMQDQNHAAFLRRSEIPEILDRHGYSTDRIANHHLFSLLEQETPLVCADRFDYALREFPIETSTLCVSHVIDHGGKMTFTDFDIALAFGSAFNKRNMQHWGGFESASRYGILAHAIRRGLEIGALEKNDFWKDDAFMLDAMMSSGDEAILGCFIILEHDRLDEFPREAASTMKKFRYVDPLFLEGDIPRRLSEIDEPFAENIARNRQINNLGVFLVDVEAALRQI